MTVLPGASPMSPIFRICISSALRGQAVATPLALRYLERRELIDVKDAEPVELVVRETQQPHDADVMEAVRYVTRGYVLAEVDSPDPGDKP